MKTRLMLLVALTGSVLTAQATLFYQGTGINTVGGTAAGSVANGGTIQDGTYPVGSYFTMNLGSAGLGNQLTSIQISLNLSGGINGNLYSYLVAPNGTTSVVLLNQPGVTGGNPFGNTQSGMNITLADGASAISSGSDLSSGTWAPSGNLVNFGSVGSPGIDPNGTWTLFFADTVNGGGDATLNGWSLEITAVPEPVNVALGIFVITLVSVGVSRRFLYKKVSAA